VFIGLHTRLLSLISFGGTSECMQTYGVSVPAKLNTPSSSNTISSTIGLMYRQ